MHKKFNLQIWRKEGIWKS